MRGEARYNIFHNPALNLAQNTQPPGSLGTDGGRKGTRVPHFPQRDCETLLLTETSKSFYKRERVNFVQQSTSATEIVWNALFFYFLRFPRNRKYRLGTTYEYVFFYIFFFRNRKGVLKNIVWKNCSAKIGRPLSRLRCCQLFSVFKLKRNFSDDCFFSHQQNNFWNEVFCIRFCFVIFRTNKIQKRKKKQHLVWIVENVDKVCLLLISRIRKKTPKCRKSTLVDRRLSTRPKKIQLFTQRFSQFPNLLSEPVCIEFSRSNCKNSLLVEHRIIVLSKNDCTFRTRVSAFSAGVKVAS